MTGPYRPISLGVELTSVQLWTNAPDNVISGRHRAFLRARVVPKNVKLSHILKISIMRVGAEEELEQCARDKNTIEGTRLLA